MDIKLLTIFLATFTFLSQMSHFINEMKQAHDWSLEIRLRFR